MSRTEVDEGLAERIKRRRLAAGLTQGQMADRLGISRVSVTNWESGRGRPDIDRLSVIGELLSVNTDWLLAGGDEPSDPNPSNGQSALWLDAMVTVQNGIPVVTMPMTRFLALMERIK